MVSAIVFLDEAGLFSNVKNLIDSDICSLGKNRHDVYSVSLEIDVMKVFGVDSRLGSLLVKNVQYFISLLNSILKQSLDCLSDGFFANKPTRIQPRIHNLPLLKMFDASQCLHDSLFCNSLFSCSGTVLGVSDIVGYPQYMKFHCKTSTCLGSNTQKPFILSLSLGKAQTDAQLKNGFKCRYCSVNLVEDMSSRQLGKKALVLFCSENLHFSFCVIVKDTLVDRISLGQSYLLTGVKMYEIEGSKKIDFLMDVAGVLRLKERTEAPTELGTRIREFVSFNQDPIEIMIFLAYNLANKILPAELCMDLKLFLLLSLATNCETTQENAIHLLLCSREATLMNRLISYVGKLSEFGVKSFSSSNLTPVTPTITPLPGSESDFPPNTPFTEAGLLNFADKGGMCHFPAMSHLTNVDKASIRCVLDSGSVQLKIPTGLSRKLGEQDVRKLPIACTLWGVCDASHPSRCEHCGFDTFGVVVCPDWLPSNGGDPNNGSVPMSTQASSNEDQEAIDFYDYSVAKQCMNKHLLGGNAAFPSSNRMQADDTTTSSSTPLQMTKKVFKEWIRIARRTGVPKRTLETSESLPESTENTPELDEQSENLIKFYFVQIRSRSAMVGDANVLTRSGARVLLNLATSVARLCLRVRVTLDDVVFAIRLFDTSLRRRGATCLLADVQVLGIGPTNGVALADHIEHAKKVCLATKHELLRLAETAPPDYSSQTRNRYINPEE